MMRFMFKPLDRSKITCREPHFVAEHIHFDFVECVTTCQDFDNCPCLVLIPEPNMQPDWAIRFGHIKSNLSQPLKRRDYQQPDDLKPYNQ